jgi:hypothetical protein
LLDLSLPTYESYAHRHGWELVVQTADRARGRPAAWGKVPIMHDLVLEYDVVVWLDADAIIVDGSRDLTAELRPSKDLYLVEHTNEVTGEVVVNSGVLMLRGGRWADAFLAAVWAREDLTAHRWWENAAVAQLLGYQTDPFASGRIQTTEWFRRVHLLDLAWNSLPAWDASTAPRINHYAGLPLTTRYESMQRDISTAR